SATDDVDGSVAVTCKIGATTITSPRTFPLGTTTVDCTATDAAGNEATGSFTVTVRDTTGPTITSVSLSPTSISPANNQMRAITWSGTATDAVTSNPAVRLISV